MGVPILNSDANAEDISRAEFISRALASIATFQLPSEPTVPTLIILDIDPETLIELIFWKILEEITELELDPVIVSEIILPFKSIPLIKNEFEEVFVLDEIFTLEPR